MTLRDRSIPLSRMRSGIMRRIRDMREFYERLERLDYDRDNEVNTVVRGKHTGEKVLLTDGQVVYTSSADLETALKKLPEDSVYREKLGHIQTLVVCGAGFVGQSVIRLGKFLGWRVLSVEDRPDFAKEAQRAGADEVLCGPFSDVLSGISYDEDIFFVIVTREHSYDKACLDEILKHPFGYLGMMGSHKRAAGMKKTLKEANWPEDVIAKLHAPIGISVGAQTPEEIAVSIAAEMICEKQKQNGRYHFPDDIMDGIRGVYGKQEGGEAHAVLATIIRQIGSTPRKAGARMLVYPDGSATGTIGGGSMEGAVIRRAVETLRDPSSFEPSLLTVDLTGRYGEYADMMCGGITEIFVELI